MAECPIPPGSPVLTVVVHLAKLGALLRVGRVGVEDAVLLNPTGAQADSLAGVLLAQAPDRLGCRMTMLIAKSDLDSFDVLDQS